MKPSKSIVQPIIIIGISALVLEVFFYYAISTGEIQRPDEWGGSIEGYINLLSCMIVSPPIIFAALVFIRFGSLVGENYYQKNLPELVKNEFQHNVLEKEYIDTLDDQSKVFLNAPLTTLIFVDILEVESLHSLYFDETTITGITNEVFGESSHEIGANFPNIGGAKLGNRGSSKTTQNIKPAELSIAKKFFRLQRILILKQQIVTSLELIDIDLSQYQEMNSVLLKLKKEYGLTFQKSSDEIDIVKKSLLRDAANEMIKRLESAKDLVLIDAKFNVLNENEDYIFVYDHPVNRYLSDKENEVTIRFTIPANSISFSQNNFHQLVGKTIRLKVFAKILLPLNTKSDNWEVVIKPIAVY
jgi:hypothetical protein